MNGFMEDGMDPILDAPDHSGTGPDPDDPILRSDICAYEVHGVIRMIRAGWPGQVVIKDLGMSRSDLEQVLDLCYREEQLAIQQKRPIWAAMIRKEQV
ncbi:hypothetical protein ACWCPQ_14465 [Nocardia sp. NPDC001965]